MGPANKRPSSLTIAGITSPPAERETFPAASAVELPIPCSTFLERLFNSPDPPARTISSYLDIEDIVSLRRSCRLHEIHIQHGGKWGWMLQRVSTRKTAYPNPDARRQLLTLGVPPKQREYYISGRQVVVVDVSVGDRDFLKLNAILLALNVPECLTSLILDGTAVDVGDVGHLLKACQNVATLSLRHCWNVNLQLLYKLFKKSAREHMDEVNFYNHVDQQRIKSKSPAEQIEHLRIWDIDGIEPLMDERSENGHRLVSQINVTFFMRNFDVDLKVCKNKHNVLMVCVGERLKCQSCNKCIWVEICPKCRLKATCEVCGYYICDDCGAESGGPSAGQSTFPHYSGPASDFTPIHCRSPQCKWHDNRHHVHPECITKPLEKCVFCSRHICLLQRSGMDRSFMCEACQKFSCGCRRLQSCGRCQGYLCDGCFGDHGRECQWQKG